VANKLIPEPQGTYALELLTNLGSAADSFVLAGAQALKFLLPKARATRDFDFVLDVVALREASVPIATILEKLGYAAIPGAQNFQFQKTIPDSIEIMRIEFMAPSEYKRKNDFRVDIQENVHAHACDGGKIVLAESELRELSGRLPNGQNATIAVRVTLPHSLVLLKCLAIDDRYRNLRGPEHAEHDRSEARTHVEDIVAVLTAQTNLPRRKPLLSYYIQLVEESQRSAITRFSGENDAYNRLTFFPVVPTDVPLWEGCQAK